MKTTTPAPLLFNCTGDLSGGNRGCGWQGGRADRRRLRPHHAQRDVGVSVLQPALLVLSVLGYLQCSARCTRLLYWADGVVLGRVEGGGGAVR
jgi:hypothetical protein